MLVPSPWKLNNSLYIGFMHIYKGHYKNDEANDLLFAIKNRLGFHLRMIPCERIHVDTCIIIVLKYMYYDSIFQIAIKFSIAIDSSTTSLPQNFRHFFRFLVYFENYSSYSSYISSLIRVI